MAVDLALTITRGDTFTKTVTLTEDGAPANTEGRTYNAELVDRLTFAVEPAATFTLSPTETPGQFIISLSAAQTTLLPRYGYWRLVETEGSTRRTLVAGTAQTEVA